MKDYAKTFYEKLKLWMPQKKTQGIQFGGDEIGALVKGLNSQIKLTWVWERKRCLISLHCFLFWYHVEKDRTMKKILFLYYSQEKFVNIYVSIMLILMIINNIKND